MALVKQTTLILTTSPTAVEQWRRELLDKTDPQPEDIAEYTGEQKDIGPVTIATYQIISYRPERDERVPPLRAVRRRDWGLIIYDEVHLLPAPVFRITADLQARRRLGLTATLVREDGREEDVFCLIGPKKFDVPWKVLEQQGWIADRRCHEVRVPLRADAHGIRLAERRESSARRENPAKEDLLRGSSGAARRTSRVLIIGQYLDQLEPIAERSSAADHRARPERRAASGSTSVPPRRDHAAWSSPRSATSRSTCPTPTS